MKLQEVRKQRNLTQAQLAEKSGVKLRSIQEYEYGRKTVNTSRLDTLLRLADALNVPFYKILDDEQLVERVKVNINKE